MVYLKLPFINKFKACLVLKVIFSKLISLIYFNIFIEDFELVMLVSSLIYLVSLFSFCYFVLEIKFGDFFLSLFSLIYLMGLHLHK